MQVAVGDERPAPELSRYELAGTDSAINRVAADAGQRAALRDRVRSAVGHLRLSGGHVSRPLSPSSTGRRGTDISECLPSGQAPAYPENRKPISGFGLFQGFGTENSIRAVLSRT